MNVVLLRDDERLGDLCGRVRGPRSRHLIETLGVAPGRRLRAGIPDSGLADAIVTAVQADAVDLRLLAEPRPSTCDDDPGLDLILALPRPKVLGRVLEHAAAIGVSRVVVMRARKVEKSYFQSDVVAAGQWREHFLRGLEIAGGYRVPEFQIEPLFRPFVEDRLVDWVGKGAEVWVATPGAERLVRRRSEPAPRAAVVIGPEGGFDDFEVELLRAAGVRPLGLGRRILRVEAAAVLALGALTVD